jgi:hypothetical protein
VKPLVSSMYLDSFVPLNFDIIITVGYRGRQQAPLPVQFPSFSSLQSARAAGCTGQSGARRRALTGRTKQGRLASPHGPARQGAVTRQGEARQLVRAVVVPVVVVQQQ